MAQYELVVRDLKLPNQIISISNFRALTQIVCILYTFPFSDVTRSQKRLGDGRGSRTLFLIIVLSHDMFSLKGTGYTVLSPGKCIIRIVG